LKIASLQKNLFFAGKEDIVVSQIPELSGGRVLILPHLGWGRVYLLLGIHHTLVWNRILKNGRRWLLQVLLRGLLRGRQCWRMLCVHGFFHSFEVGNLGAMVSIMPILTTNFAMEVRPNIFIVLSLSFVILVPLGVLVALILVYPSYSCPLGGFG
jgi:hypothetical protein